MANPAIVTTDSTVYPSENQIETTQFEGSRGQEKTHGVYVNEGWSGNHVDSGFTLPATDPDLDIPVAAGIAFINGRRVETDSSNDLTMAPSTTNHIFLQLLFDGSSNTLTVQLVANTTGTPPANSVKIGRAVTDATTVTSTIDERLPDPYKADRITGKSLDIVRHTSTPADPASFTTTFTTVATFAIPAETMRGRSASLLVLWVGVLSRSVTPGWSSHWRRRIRLASVAGYHVEFDCYVAQVGSERNWPEGCCLRGPTTTQP